MFPPIALALQALVYGSLRAKLGDLEKQPDSKTPEGRSQGGGSAVTETGRWSATEEVRVR